MKLTTSNNNYTIFINSLAFYLLSYFFIFCIMQFVTGLTSTAFDIPVTIYNNKISYNVKPDTWTSDSVKIIFSASNIALFLLSIINLVVYLKALEFDGLLRMFFLWGFIISFSTMIGSTIIGAFNFEGFGIVMSYLYLQDTVKMIILFIGIFILLAVGMMMVKPMLFSANMYYSFLSPEMRHTFRSSQFFWPFFVANLIILLFKFPVSLYETLILYTPLIMLLPLYWGIKRFPTFYFEETNKNIKISYIAVFTAVLILLLLRLVLGKGINLG